VSDVTWTIEAAEHPASKEEVWMVKDAPSGTVWAVFYDRVAADACVRGWKAIGFVADRPTVEFRLDQIAQKSKDEG
jgi:hypothetical protein